LMRDLAESEWEPVVQSEHQPTMIHAAVQFIDHDEADLAIVGTRLRWSTVNGMLEVGLKRRGEQLDEATERGTLEYKLTARWRELFGLDFPDALLQSILALARARNSFVHYKWPMHSAQEHDERRAEVTRLGFDAPRIFAALHGLEDSIVFHGERKRLNSLLRAMEL
jgi:hypothetical protein